VTSVPNEELMRRMMLLARPGESFRPTASYDADGDCIEFLFKPDPFYAERVDDLLTVYYSQESHDVIGSLIKGVSSFCRKIADKMPGFQLDVQDRKVRIVHIFRAGMWDSTKDPSGMASLSYKKLISVADSTKVEADMPPIFA